MKPGHTGRSAKRKGNAAPLAAHKAFAPLLGLWGALLGGLVMMVLPAAVIETGVSGTLIGTFGDGAQPALAGIAAALLGVPLFGIAAQMHRRARRSFSAPSLAESAMRRVTPINPTRDLGSRCLDDPVDPTPVKALAPEAEPLPAPVELDLAQFAGLPGRNAVWVEEVQPSPQTATAPDSALASALQAESEPVTDIRVCRLRAVAPAPAPGSAALARLRAVEASELSLAQMVERFAGALHEHRQTQPLRSLSAADLATREAALAEALRALSVLSGDAADPARKGGDEPLRAALARLHTRRGVA